MRSSGNGVAAHVLLAYMSIGNGERAKHIAAMMLIGEGIMALLYPAKEDAEWKSGSKLMRGTSGRPGLTRVVGAAQIVGGIWWALHQQKAKQDEIA